MSLYEKDPSKGLNAAVAAELRAEKAASNLTLSDIARLSGVTKGSVQRYLAAERHIDMRTLNALALALGTTPGELIERAQERRARDAGSALPDPLDLTLAAMDPIAGQDQSPGAAPDEA